MLTALVAIFFLGMGVLAVAIALGGTAAGRLVAAVVEPPSSFYKSWFYFRSMRGSALR